MLNLAKATQLICDWAESGSMSVSIQSFIFFHSPLVTGRECILCIASEYLDNLKENYPGCHSHNFPQFQSRIIPLTLHLFHRGVTGREKYLLVMILDLKGIHCIRILGSLCILSDLPSDYKIK